MLLSRPEEPIKVREIIRKLGRKGIRSETLKYHSNVDVEVGILEPACPNCRS